MAHNFESSARRDCLARVEEHRADFGFGGGRHDRLDNLVDGEYGAVVGGELVRMPHLA